MMEATIHGHAVRLLATHQAPGVILDTWEDLGEPQGSVFRVGVVVTFQKGHDLVDGSSGVWDPFVPGQVWAMAYDDHPSDDPVARFQEAIRQERERAFRRLTEPVQWEQVWP